ncbi:MAG: hypothetical protein ACYTGG_05100 [Planctomycetota bacterium]
MTGPHPVRGLVVGGGIALALIVLAACQPYRVEYHKRPSYYRKAALGDLPDEVVLEDGTRIIYSSDGHAGEWGNEKSDDGKAFEIREEDENGDVTLRAIMPEHVIANTITCLRNQEYELLWDQMLARQTRENYVAAGLTAEDFMDFCRKNRRDLLEALMRMMIGMVHQDVVVENVGPGMIRCRLRARVAANFRFTMVDVVAEGAGMKLLMIQ